MPRLRSGNPGGPKKRKPKFEEESSPPEKTISGDILLPYINRHINSDDIRIVKTVCRHTEDRYVNNETVREFFRITVWGVKRKSDDPIHQRKIVFTQYVELKDGKIINRTKNG